MTQPVQEPLTQRSISGLKWTDNQLLRRPAPTAGASSTLPYCYMTWIGSEAITVNTLQNPATVGTPDVPYEDGFVYDPDFLADFTLDLDTGCISWDMPGLYFIHATVEWNGTSSGGSTLGACLRLGNDCVFSTARVINSQVADIVNENAQIPVSAFIWYDNFGHNSIRVNVYHTDAGGNDIGAVKVHVVQVNSNTDGEFFS